MSRENILNEISIERDRQDDKFAHQNAKCTLWQLMSFFAEESGECAKALNDAYDFQRGVFLPIPVRELRKELVQTAAMAVQIVERIDRGLVRDGLGEPEHRCPRCLTPKNSREAGKPCLQCEGVKGDAR